MSPAPAVREPHANRLTCSHPVDMHAHAIITAPMTNTKSEPIANLRIQGIVSSNLGHRTRSGSEALPSRLRRLHLPVRRYLYFLPSESEVTILAGALQFEIGCDFVAGTTRWIVFFLQSDSAIVNAVSSLVLIEMMFGLSPLTFKPTTLQSSSLNKTDISLPPPLKVMFEVA